MKSVIDAKTRIMVVDDDKEIREVITVDFCQKLAVYRVDIRLLSS